MFAAAIHVRAKRRRHDTLEADTYICSSLEHNRSLGTIGGDATSPNMCLQCYQPLT